MGVYIKGMSKPKECKKCKFYIVEAKVEGKIYPLNAYCFAQHQNIKDFTDCPLIEIDLVRCGECKWWDSDDGNIGYCHAEKHCHFSSNWEISIYRKYKADHFCSDGERRNNE